MLLNTSHVFNFFELLQKDSLSLFYQGVTHDDITDKLISLSDTNIRSQAGLDNLRKKVSFAISECFQNVIRHQEEPATKQGNPEWPSMFMVRNQGSGYYIGSVNLIKKRKAFTLKQQLQDLNALNAEELRQMYIQLLPSAEFSEKGGAGLGLIEMARKSKQKFDFDFLHLNKRYSLFSMQLSIVEGELRKEAPNLQHTSILYEQLLQQQVMLLYRSDFSQEGMLPLLDMMEGNLQKSGSDKLKQKKVLYVLVELFQNIIKHAAMVEGRQEGILLISVLPTGYELYTGNFVANTHINELKNHLEHLNSLDEAALGQLYRQELVRASASVKGGAGLGLIETARYSRNPFRYTIIPVNREVSFFSLGVAI